MKQSVPTITGASRAVLLLGRPLDHSLSPLMQNAAFQQVGLPWVYMPLEVTPAGLGGVLKAVRGSNVRGANVTVPYKEAVLPWLDKVDPEAKELGSVNTLYFRGKELRGTSTDGEGFLRSLGPMRKRLRGSRGLLLGSGGAAKAVAGALAGSGVREVLVANRTPGRASRLIRTVRAASKGTVMTEVPWRDAEGCLARCDWVVQSTSLGLDPKDPSPISLASAKRGLWVVDLIYHRETSFLREARRRGLWRSGGLGMLLHQGALSFERWTGRKAPVEVMRRALTARLRSS